MTKDDAILKVFGIFDRMRAKHVISFVLLMYGIMLSDQNMKMGSALYIKTHLGNHLTITYAILCVVISALVLLSKGNPKTILLATIPQLIYSMFSVQWYLNIDGTPIAGFILHIMISFLVFYITIENGRNQ